MTESHKDSLLLFGRTLARLLQWGCAIAAGLALLLVPVILLASRRLLPDFGESDVIAASPLSAVAIVAMLALILAALSHFFGKLRAIVASTSEGDPFTPENAKRLSAMAWLFLGVKILTVLIVALRHHLAGVIDKGASGDSVLGFSLYDLDALLIVVVLFILARIVRDGAAMRDDLVGTV